MGGFLLARRENNSDVTEMKKLLETSLDVFREKGLPLHKKVVARDYILYVFNKYQSTTENTLLYQNGDFIVSTGTMFYKGKMGTPALDELFHDFSIENHDFFSNVLGNHCLIVSKGGKLFLANNPSGIYRVYCDQHKKLFSTSFLAIFKSLKEHNIGKQEFYEYMFDGAVYGDKTILQEIEIVDVKNIWQLSPVLAAVPLSLKFQNNYSFSSFDESVNECAGQLIQYYDAIKEYYGDSVCAALTAGMDTRLMFACMRHVDIKPYLYVYSYGQAGNTNVQIARMIAAKEGLEMDHEDKSQMMMVDTDAFPAFLEKQHYIYDGLGLGGIFGNGSDIETRLKRIHKTRLQLNGGGYLLRLFYSLPDKPISIMSFLKAKHDNGNYTMCRDFNKHAYYSSIAEKIKNILNINTDKISRKQVEQLFFNLRIRYWTPFNHMINEELSDTLIPGIEPQFTRITLNIPYKFMYLGIFQAAVIKHIHPDIAKYPSQYGYNFYDYENVPLRTRIKEYLQFHTPITLRPYIRRYYLNKPRKNNFSYYYLDKEYLDTVFPSSEPIISKYVDISKIMDPLMLSRVLSVEYLLTNKR